MVFDKDFNERLKLEFDGYKEIKRKIDKKEICELTVGGYEVKNIFYKTDINIAVEAMKIANEHVTTMFANLCEKKIKKNK